MRLVVEPGQRGGPGRTVAVEPYRDADGVEYIPMPREPVMVMSGTGELLAPGESARERRREDGRGIDLAPTAAPVTLPHPSPRPRPPPSHTHTVPLPRSRRLFLWHAHMAPATRSA